MNGVEKLKQVYEEKRRQALDEGDIKTYQGVYNEF